jgi:anti-sigma-K factor RskA
MKYRNLELRDRLAAEYVLGTLRGAARRRFERLLMEDALLRRQVWLWEKRLNPLAQAVVPRQPSPRVWRNISSRLWPASLKTPWWEWLWRGWGVAATAAVLGLTIYFGQRVTPVVPDYVAVFNDASAKPLWLVSTDINTGQLSIRAVNAAAERNKDFELWALPPSGAAPQSLGLLPVSGQRVSVGMPARVGSLQDAQGLAVSLEPKGGSPTGLPTGPVLYQAQLISL